MRLLEYFVAEPLRHKRFDLAWYRVSQILRRRLEFAPKARVGAAKSDAPYLYDGFGSVSDAHLLSAARTFVLALHHDAPERCGFALPARARSRLTDAASRCYGDRVSWSFRSRR